MNPKALLSTLWIFLTVNYIFCDVFTLMHSEDLKALMTGQVGDIVLDQQFLLTFAFVMEIPMIMILLSRVLRYKLNRILNIVAGVIMTLVQVGSLMAEDNTLHYIFFSIVEISTCLYIIWYSIKWKEVTAS